MEILNKIYELDKKNHIELVLDTIFEWFDENYNANNFTLCDFFLKLMDVEICSISVLIGVLTITLDAKDKLINRKFFFKKVKEKLENGQRDDISELLMGLE